MQKSNFLSDNRLSSADKLLMVYIKDTGITDLYELLKITSEQDGIDEKLIRASYKRLQNLNYIPNS